MRTVSILLSCIKALSGVTVEKVGETKQIWKKQMIKISTGPTESLRCDLERELTKMAVCVPQEEESELGLPATSKGSLLIS